MEYHNPSPINRKRALEIFASGSSFEMAEALVAVALNEDESWQWVQELCLQFLDHSDANIRRVAATCLGHVARIHRKLDRELVIRALKTHLKEEKIPGYIEEALDDIHTYLEAFGAESTLTTFEEYMSEYGELWYPENLEEAEKRFPYTTTIKWTYQEMDIGHCWCWQMFGPKQGYCYYQAPTESYRPCPLILTEGLDHVKPHSHIGVWTSVWLGKTDYDFGYEKFFFKNKADRDSFEEGVRAIEYDSGPQSLY